MTGPEHYAEAERLLVQADRDVSVNMETLTGERKSDVLAAAQAHATLALVAATVEAAFDPQGHHLARDWPLS